MQFRLQWLVASQAMFLVVEFEGISAISVRDIAVKGFMAITFTVFTGLVM